MSGRFGVWDCNDFGAGGKVDMVWVVLAWVDMSVTDNFDKVGCDRVGFGARVCIVGKVCSFGDDHKDFDLDRVEA